MKISTKGRYALRLMLDLAVNFNGAYIPLKEIAIRQGISDKYLEQIIIQLNKAGFVKSIRGSQGGYKLANEPKYYTVGSILRLMEGSLSPVACLDNPSETCDRVSDCVTLEVWIKLKEAIDSVVDNITLQDLVDRHFEKGTCEYYI
ncbi:Rrf2 family transcriptional regulator [Paludicola sp. MB14-C6]|uniref:RrF2 family transcriptional regulator n=1 Tax=Paludihabitans sp. MB14-C6 TaxID=3070656 RepID=UPI0027DC0F44|nr:Rrf2 family transcriptional regulator [Paludicola sp. MB14-C6]WMJ23855.1 Rrf2 family transcriptional regulator [Paludicola sp. MB14-C6]